MSISACIHIFVMSHLTHSIEKKAEINLSKIESAIKMSSSFSSWNLSSINRRIHGKFRRQISAATQAFDDFADISVGGGIL